MHGVGLAVRAPLVRILGQSVHQTRASFLKKGCSCFSSQPQRLFRNALGSLQFSFCPCAPEPSRPEAHSSSALSSLGLAKAYSCQVCSKLRCLPRVDATWARGRSNTKYSLRHNNVSLLLRSMQWPNWWLVSTLVDNWYIGKCLVKTQVGKAGTFSATTKLKPSVLMISSHVHK